MLNVISWALSGVVLYGLIVLVSKLPVFTQIALGV
ncbi:hypothetical phage protein [Citrobacter phage CR8]|uniref:Hypothetical phage protein n=1 Tax=Citrobacter phage CR8 TaxID=1455076 RepID=A0A024M9Q9_9CAUD|nr:hypothetical protein CF79_gp07 [Citrobacter phage CR8]CDP90351.1 hypothetical phage protein [Citrobacter phage CR8]